MTRPEKIKSMMKGGAILSEILINTIAKITAGMSTAEIEEVIAGKMDEAGAKPSFKTVDHYPFYSCIGLNDEVVHSLPSPKKIVQKGDLLKIDTGLIWDGWHTDMSWTAQINQQGKTEFDMDFLNAGKLALADAIQHCRPGNRVGHISQAIQKQIESAGLQIVKSLTGHSIGRQLHERPFIPGFVGGNIENTPLLRPGMALAIEVIYSSGNGKIVLESDGWTICTQDGKMSGLFEQTVAVTPEGPLILTPVPTGF